VRQISTKDPKVLLEFWRQNRKLRQKVTFETKRDFLIVKEAENLNKSRVNAKNNQSFHSQVIKVKRYPFIQIKRLLRQARELENFKILQRREK